MYLTLPMRGFPVHFL